MAAGGIELARVFVAIMPEASHIAPGMRRITGDVTRQMDRTGRILGGQLAGTMSTASAQAVRSLKDVEKYTDSVAKANAKNKDALGKVRVAQAGLEDLNKRSTVTTKARVSAEEALAKAQRNQQFTARALSAETKLLNAAQTQAKSARVMSGVMGGSFLRMQEQAAATGMMVESRLTGGLQRAASRGGNFMLGALRRVGTAAAAVGGIGGVFAAGSVLSGGLERLKTIEDASTSMRQLMGDADAAKQMVGSVTDLAQGTPYTADQFLNMARNLVAMGASADQVTPSIEALANAVAASGQGPETLDQLADAYGKIVTQGKITGNEMLSLSQAGVPALRILANHLGVTAAEAQKMVSKSLIPANEAIEALNRGIMEGTSGPAGETRAFTGVLQQLRETYSGSMMVFQAQEKILAAEFLRPLFDRAPAGLNALSEKMKELRPSAQQLGTGLADGIERFIGWLSSPGVKSGMESMKSGLSDVMTAARDMAPGLSSAASAIGTMLTGGGLTAWKLFAETVKTLAPLLNTLAGALGRNQGLVNGLGIVMGSLYLKSRLLPPALTAIDAASKGWSATIGQLRAPLRDVTDRTTGMVKQTGLLTRAQAGLLSPVGQMRMEYLRGAQQAAAFGRSQQLNTQFARDLRTQMVGQLGVWGRFRTSIGDTTTRLQSMQGVMGATRAATSGLRMAGSALLGVFGGPLGLAVAGASVGLGVLAARHQEAAAAAQQLRQRELELQATLDDVSGKVTMETRDTVARRFDDDAAYKGNSVFRRAEGFGIAEKDLVDAATGDDAAYGSIRGMADQAIGSALDDGYVAKMVEHAKQAGVGREELLSALAREGNGWDEVNQKIKAYNETQSHLPTTLGKLDDLVKQLPDLAESWTVLTQAINEERREVTAGQESRQRQIAGVHGLWKETEAATKWFGELGAQILATPTEHDIVVDVLDEEARASLDELGFTITQLPDGTVRVTAQTDEAKAKAAEFVAEVNSTTAVMEVDVDTRRAYSALSGLRGMIAGIEAGDIGASPAAQKALDSLPPLPARARGGLDVWGASFARGKLPDSAVIQHPVGSAGLVQWAEPSTHGEAFIPLAPGNRDRSLAIWAETGKRLGAIRGYEQGGLNPGPSYVADLLVQQYPQVSIGSGDDSGNALNVSIPGWDTPQGRALGNAIASFALMNADALGLTSVLWQQKQFGPGDRAGSPLPDRGGPSQNHLDHLQIFMSRNGGQLPSAPVLTHGAASMGLGSSGADGGGGGGGASSRKVRNAQNRVDDTAFRVEQAQRKLDELPDGAKLSQREAAEHALMKAQRDHQDALEDLTEAETKAAKSKEAGGGPDAKSFGAEFLKGIGQAVGFDGELFSDPTQWGITKLGTGIVNLFGNVLKKSAEKDDEDEKDRKDRIAGPGNPTIGDGGFGDGDLGGLGFGDGGFLSGMLTSVLPNVSDFIPNSQGGGNSYTTNKDSHNVSNTGQVFNGPVNVTNNNAQAGMSGRANAYAHNVPGGRR